MSKKKKTTTRGTTAGAKQQSQPQTKAQSKFQEGSDEDINSLAFMKRNKPAVKFRTQRQEEFWNLMDKKEITLCAGPAGTGKSHLSVLKAIHLLFSDDNKYKKIVIITPIVEADEKLGALPGTVEEKTAPYTYSTLYLFEKILGERKVGKLMEKGIIKVMALAYLRGVNIDETILLFEEAQNATERQVRTLLTRIGFNSKFIISGDLEQSDRFVQKDIDKSGLKIAMSKLKDVPEIGQFEFGLEDVVRNPIIRKIIERLKN